MNDVFQDNLERIVTRLQTINPSTVLPSPLTAYANTLSVAVEEQQPASPRNCDVVVMDADPVQQDNPPYGFDEYLLPLGIVCYAIEPESSSTTIGERLRSIAADVRKALGLELLAEDRLFLNIHWPEKDQYFDEGAPASVLLVPHLQIHTYRNDPTRNRFS